MIADIGRTIVNLTAPNGEVFAFFNSEIANKADINYFEKHIAKSEYRITYSETEKKRKYRALHYARYLPNGAIDPNPRVVPCQLLPHAKDTTQLIAPLYETITPGVGYMRDKTAFNLVFWSNLSDKKNTLAQDQAGNFQYDPSKILRFENDKLEEVDLDDYSWKILCSASIEWRNLRTIGGIINDTNQIRTPLITAVYVIMAQEGNIAIDFSGGGSGGGMRRHNHTDNNNAGFAHGVFATGTALQPINWK